MLVRDWEPSASSRGGQDFTPATKAHVAYQVHDLAKMRARLDAAGVAVVEDEPLPGYHRFYVADPFGNRVELLQINEDDGARSM